MTDVDEIFALSLRLSERFDGRDHQSLIARVRKLSPSDGQSLRDRCMAVGTPHALDLIGLCLTIGVPKDEKGAVVWYRRSAELGYSTAMSNLGYCLCHGIGTAKDEKEGLKWTQRSADLGDPVGMNNLGHYLEHGIGTTKDAKKAVEWYQKSVELGHPGAMNNLGMCLYSGMGIAQDNEKANELFRKAKTGASYWNLADDEKDPLTQLNYYCRAWQTYPESEEGNNRTECREKINTLIANHSFEVLQRWVDQQDETATLKARVQELETQCEALTTELDYRPGGAGFQEARRDFELLASDPTPSRRVGPPV